MGARNPAEVDDLFVEHVNNGNLDKLVALYEPSAALVMPDGEHKGHPSIRAALAAIAEGRVQLRMNVTRVVEAGDLAVLYNDWEGTTADGQAMSGRAIEIVRRQPDGSWLFALDDPYARG